MLVEVLTDPLGIACEFGERPPPPVLSAGAVTPALVADLLTGLAGQV